jgi:hypothetical protein
MAYADSAAAVLVLRPLPSALKDTLGHFQAALAGTPGQGNLGRARTKVLLLGRRPVDACCVPTSGARRPRAMMRFQAHKPVPLPLLQPDFVEGGFFAKGSRDPDIRETRT